MELERKIVNRIKVVLLFSVLLLLCLSVSVDGISMWPAKLEITLSEGYQNEDIIHPIQVTNPLTRAINVTAVVSNPANESLTEGYSFIPNVSWIRVVPEELYVPANSSSLFQLIVEIPDSEVPLQYNKSWETWVTIASDQYGGVDRGAAFKVELAMKVFIDTPSGEAKFQIQNLFLPLGIVLIIIVLSLLFFFLKIKRK